MLVFRVSLVVSLLWVICVDTAQANAEVVPLPEYGAYVGAYVDSGPMADQVSTKEILAFDALVGKKMKWTYFSDNWIDGNIEFPIANVRACDRAGTIPYIRMSPWTEARTYQRDDWLHMEGLLAGNFDGPLLEWARSAKEYGKPLIVEFGPEVNGNWFPWNGQHNGGGTTSLYGDPDWPDGPERYRDVFRKIIDMFRAEGVENIVWVFHVDTAWAPWSWWNEPKYYYPGNDYIDWIGLSVFGRQLPQNEWLHFTEKLNFFWNQVDEVSRTKPVIIVEAAVIEDQIQPGRKAEWFRDVFQTLQDNPVYRRRIKGFSYWNSPGFYPDDVATSMKVDTSESSLEAFVEGLQSEYWIGRE